MLLKLQTMAVVVYFFVMDLFPLLLSQAMEAWFNYPGITTVIMMIVTGWYAN